MKVQSLEHAGPASAVPDLDNQLPQIPAQATANIADASGFEERVAWEMAWLRQVPSLEDSAAYMLAARGAMSYLTTRGLRSPGSGPAKPGMVNGVADPSSLNDLGLPRFAWPGDTGERASPETIATLRALWPLAASAEEILASGGDERLSLHPVSRTNKYGCTPWPRDEIISFGSCTASCLTQRSFQAAETERRRLLTDAVATSPARALADASDRIASALLHYYGIADIAAAVLAASGTDAALLVTGLLAAENPGQALTSVLVSPFETGSGVPNAVQGRHFAAFSPDGGVAGMGEPIDGLARHALALTTIALRDSAGEPLPEETVLSSLETAIAAGQQKGRVVLHAMDGSKTGLTAPGRRACRQLARRFGAALDIVIDACQARLEPAMIRWYLSQGFPVLITGSKFFAAPGFCGAVLFPRRRFDKIARSRRLPPGLAAYARLNEGFGSRRCAGLILRWTAALAEMSNFAAVPSTEVRRRLQGFAAEVSSLIGRHPRLRLIGAPRPPGMGWSDCPSVLTFSASKHGQWLSADALRPVYEGLAEGAGGLKCHIGQPVRLGSGASGGLRVAMSAPQIASGATGHAALADVFASVDRLLSA